MSLAKVRSAFVTELTTGNFLAPAADIQWPNKKFDAAGKAFWAAFWFFPDQPIVATLGKPGSGGTDDQGGFVQLDLNYATDSGEAAALAKFADLSSRFTAGARFSYQGQVVTVRSCGCSQGRIVDGFYRVSVTIPFYARIPR